ncbi:MAG: lysophospholipid acyltransferase family protein [Chloroflexota bacterium]|nr:lysophospholipid acyltransferase family protein [Anaerolineales bacterium]MCB8968418.1 lysophospholipid acyltransferase family protein [Ardenticatenaceae bacterium]
MTDYLAPVTSRFDNVMQIKLGEAVPKRGNRYSRAFAIGLLAIFGWRITGEIPNLPKFLVVGAPHTSNWDMLLGMVGMYAIGFQIFWMAKHSLFRWPFAGLMRWLGGVPVDRRATQGLVGQMIEAFQAREKLILVVLPEGTRSKTRQWKTGFYHIAVGAHVPLVMAKFDYGRKTLCFGPMVELSNNIEADLPHIQSMFADIVGKHPYNQ